jgi:hypothetical protein
MRCWYVFVSLFLSLVLVPAIVAEENAPVSGAPPAESPALYRALGQVLNRGADLYNTGDRNGCYRLFQGALLALRPQVANDEGLLQTIDDGMAAAETELQVGNRAFALRAVLVEIRAKVKPKAASRK